MGEMKCTGLNVDMRNYTTDEKEERKREEQQLFSLNHMMPLTAAYDELLQQLFGNRLGEGSRLVAPLHGTALHKMRIGKGVYINSNLLAMARGGITIEDDVLIAANVQLLSNNHDAYERQVLVCKPIVIREGAWIGAGATILPGTCVGRHAVIGAASVVTADIPDYAVAVGNPATVIRFLDSRKF